MKENQSAPCRGGAAECREARYTERLKACYPIHPEVFERLYNDWATLERFQRTREVLRLMAAVIHDLWARNRAETIMAGARRDPASPGACAQGGDFLLPESGGGPHRSARIDE